MGIDVGSIVSKRIMLKDGKEIVSKSLVSVGTGTSGPQCAIEEVLENAGKTREDIDYTLVTGYGRNFLEGIVDRQMSELPCRAKGAFFLSPKMHIVTDIGGQDMKVSKIENGAMVDFQMDDKCAAKTGCFLDVMARVLEINVGDPEKLLTEFTKRIGVSSTCTIFAESEVISQLMRSTDRRDITAGIHKAIAGRVAGLVHRMDLVLDVVMMGGVAQNHGVVKALEERLSCEIKTPPLIQYNGAFGAVSFAHQGASEHAKV